MGASDQPVREYAFSPHSGRSSAARSEVRVSCQTMAREIGSPVSRFHMTVVARWLVMPIAVTSSGWSCAPASAFWIMASPALQISDASCSTLSWLGW